MSIEKILEKLSEEEREVVAAAIDAEKTRGIEKARRTSQDYQKALTKLNALRDQLRSKEIDPDGDLEEQLERAFSAPTAKPKTELEKQILTLSKQVKMLTEQSAEKEKALVEKDQKYRTTKLTQALSSAIGEKVHAPEYVVSGLIREGKVRLDDSDNPLFVDGELEVDFKTGVDRFLKANPNIIKNTIKTGSGSQSGTGDNTKTMPRAEFDQLSQADAMAYVKGGGNVT